MPSDETNGLTPCLTRSRVVGMGRSFMVIEEYVAVRCPCSDAVDVAARHESICFRAGARR